MSDRRFGSGSKARGSSRGCLCLSIVALGCQSFADLEIDYDCLAPQTPYIERFDEAPNDQMEAFLTDRCWRIEDARFQSDDKDVKLEAKNNRVGAKPWDDDPPRMVRRAEGDFVLVAQAETADGGVGDFCKLAEGDAAGIVVRSTDEEPLPLAAVTVDPDYESVGADPESDCQDDPAIAPRARVQVFADASEFDPILGVGEDGEAEIAVCRRENNLFVFYLDREAYPMRGESNPWKSAGDSLDIGEGPVDVGLVTTLSASGAMNDVQGSFNWVVLDTFDTSVPECGSYLQEFELPEEF